ncbi:MAG: hypothetical protein C0467_29460 [Planctomycetaceae bacterium]|nr:hypothetical protein [Planctomycetaceae bacterium]
MSVSVYLSPITIISRDFKRFVLVKVERVAVQGGPFGSHSVCEKDTPRTQNTLATVNQIV